jgi:hypothetical protein
MDDDAKQGRGHLGCGTDDVLRLDLEVLCVKEEEPYL